MTSTLHHFQRRPESEPSEFRHRRPGRAMPSLMLSSREPTPDVRHDTIRAGSQLRAHRVRARPDGAR